MKCQICALIVGPFAAAFTGFAFGVAYFAVLRRSVSFFVTGGGLLRLSALTLGRLVAIATFFILVARLGAAPLLAGFLGFLLARAAAVRFLGGDE